MQLRLLSVRSLVPMMVVWLGALCSSVRASVGEDRTKSVCVLWVKETTAKGHRSVARSTCECEVVLGLMVSATWH